MDYTLASKALGANAKIALGQQLLSARNRK
jgi:hypothetical protein